MFEQQTRANVDRKQNISKLYQKTCNSYNDDGDYCWLVDDSDDLKSVPLVKDQ